MMQANVPVAGSTASSVGVRGPVDPGVAFFDWTDGAAVSPREELARSLAAPQPAIPPKYFYDELGSTLFTAICEVPEYYPTRTEAAILAGNARDIAKSVGIGRTLIDLGAGDCAKAAGLFAVLQPRQYVAVDISVEFLGAALRALRSLHPELPMVGLGTDFARRLELPDAVSQHRRLFFYPGSSIGNFGPDEAVRLLSRLRSLCGSDGGLLIGVDLLKPAEVLEPAYDDALGVTAAFNLNVLDVVNRLLGADFSRGDWRHVAFLNPAQGRIEMHVEAVRPTRVRWPGGGRDFAVGERIHTENSYKYTRDGFAALLARAGLAVESCWTDPREWFAVIHARPASDRVPGSAQAATSTAGSPAASSPITAASAKPSR
jgi:dimethylhistidine N-methyltransferase